MPIRSVNIKKRVKMEKERLDMHLTVGYKRFVKHAIWAKMEKSPNTTNNRIIRHVVIMPHATQIIFSHTINMRTRSNVPNVQQMLKMRVGS